VCTLAIYVRQFATAPLVVAANRDEFHDRPAAGPAILAEQPRIVGGRDLQAGGTWLAVSEHGVVAGLLNRRTAEPPVASKRSRGELPLLMLRSSSAAAAERVLATLDGDAYNAFNLLVADRAHAWVAQNHGAALHVTPLPAGVHVLTNVDLNDPTCSRIAHSHRRFTAAGAAFAADGDLCRFRAALRTILADHALALDPRLPDALGALCVHAGPFGTCASSLLVLDDRGRWQHWFADGPPCATDHAPAPVP